MMEPSNLDNQPSGSSSFGTPSSHLHSGSHEWSPTGLILNTDQFNLNATEVLSNPEIPNTSMVQDLGLHWPYSTENYTNHSSHQVNCLTKIKEEPPGSFIKFVSKIKEPSTLDHSQLSYSLDHDKIEIFSTGEHQLNARYPAGFHTSTPCSERGNYSVVLPTTNVSGTDMSTFTSPFSNTEYQGANFLAPVGNLALFREIGGFGMGCSQQPAQEPQESHHERSPLVNGIKRGNSASDTNGSTLSAKKPRMESRSSISPFKVRKEKLGDRIAALQQLVAPFGKTDTASVLMEAIGYIKFLQDQVQTLSVPYMKSSSSNKHGTSHGVPSGEKDQESKQDLRSRGLCLVPLSCTSYVTNENLGIWPSQNSRRGF